MFISFLSYTPKVSVLKCNVSKVVGMCVEGCRIPIEVNNILLKCNILIWYIIFDKIKTGVTSH